jgi:hypothetical protein
MKIFLTAALLMTASGASAAEYCLVKRKGGEPANCFTTIGQCESKADRMNGWRCEKR